MLTPVPRPRSFSWFCLWAGARNTVSSAAFAAALALPLASTCSRAQSAPAPTLEASQLVPAWQSAAGGHMEFEVAAIHPAAPGASWHSNMDFSVEDLAPPPGGRISATTTLGGLIQFAYKLLLVNKQHGDLFAHQPKWTTTEFFTIEAKAPTANPTKDQMRLMMQSLLADRFKLAVHFESHDVPVMALVQIKPGRLGPRLRPHSQGPSCDAKIPPIDRSSPRIPEVWIPVCGTTQNVDWANNTVILGSRNTTMKSFADFVSLIEPLDRPVVDGTGLSGRFDIEVNFTPPWKMPKEQGAGAQLDPFGPSFLEGLKDDLGLKLIPTHAVVETLVIDHVEQPSPN
jgi:bla regulator protein blaR1